MGSGEFFDAGAEAIEVGAAFEPEPYEGLIVVEVDEFETIELEAIATPLADADEAALEEGIASVFDAILVEGFDGEITPEEEDDAEHFSDGDYAFSDEYDESIEDDDGFDAEPTVVLLAELNRIWAEPLAA